MMDKGPWEIYWETTFPPTAGGVVSDDFEHDVVLTISGDFADESDKLEYCEWLRNKLNQK